MSVKIIQSNALKFTAALFLLILFNIAAFAQNPGPTPVEIGKFTLHKFMQPIGEETYQVTPDGPSRIVKANFKFTDRNTEVPLTATLRVKSDLTPETLEIKGKISRQSTIDTSVRIAGKIAEIREGKETRQMNVPARFFTIAGYSPTVVQMMMLRYMAKNKIKNSIATLPGGTVTVEKRGTDTVQFNGRPVVLQRYLIGGLIWGRESVWTDPRGDLVALVGLDAEFDHFESIRAGYESSLNLFVSQAAADGMASLSELSQKLSPAQKGTLAIVNANVIDGTGAAPVMNATVVIENGRIKAVGPAASVAVPKGAKIFDAQGKYLLPGLWDMHAHFAQVEWGPVYLAAGVTTATNSILLNRCATPCKTARG